MRSLDQLLLSERGIALQRRVLPRLLAIPPALAYAVAGRPPRGAGTTLDLATWLFLRIRARSGVPELHELGAIEARRVFNAGFQALSGRGPDMKRVDDLQVDAGEARLKLRIYSPQQHRAPGPGLVYLHGGGWVVGGCQTHDALCRWLAERAGLVVASVEYRLAPEHAFPAALHDALAAFAWTRQNAKQLGIDPALLAVGGDSAGGNLATVLCQEHQRRGLRQPRAQLLIYPVCDARMQTASQREFARGYLLEHDTMQWFRDSYLGDHADLTDPRVSPLFGAAFGLAPALLVTAGFDPLRDEGDAYAKHLSDAGVRLWHQRYPRLTHGFAQLTGCVPAARLAVDEIACQLRLELGRNGAHVD